MRAVYHHRPVPAVSLPSIGATELGLVHEVVDDENFRAACLRRALSTWGCCWQGTRMNKHCSAPTRPSSSAAAPPAAVRSTALATSLPPHTEVLSLSPGDPGCVWGRVSLPHPDRPIRSLWLRLVRRRLVPHRQPANGAAESAKPNSGRGDSANSDDRCSLQLSRSEFVGHVLEDVAA